MSASEVKAVLDGQVHYDDAAPAVQAEVRVAWDELVRTAAQGLDMVAALEADGVWDWVELDDEGKVVHRQSRETEHPS